MRKLIKQMKNEEGFTLLEMSIVLIIIAALLLLIIPNVGTVNKQTQNTTDGAVVSTVEAQMQLYKMENPEITATDEELAALLEDKKVITIEQLNAYTRAKTSP